MIVVNSFVLSGSVLVVCATVTLHVNVNDECDVRRAADSTPQFFIMIAGNHSKRLRAHLQCIPSIMIDQHAPISKRQALGSFKTPIKESDLQIRDLRRLQSLQLQ